MVLGQCQEPGSPPSCLFTPSGFDLQPGLRSPMAPAALTWKHRQLGGAGWMWQPGQGSLQELRAGSAAVLGVHTQNTP